MPTKGYFTQGVAVLLRQAVPLADLEPLLAEYKIVKRKTEVDRWEFGGPSLVIEYLPAVNGYVSVDVVNKVWPDSMGDPKSEPELFAAWGMGHFGPFAWPGSLERARQHSYLWKDVAALAGQHQAFVRVRMSYVFGAAENAPVIPEGCRPVDELNFVSGIAMKLLRHPQAICYFNPNGELLSSASRMKEIVDHYRKVNLPPVDLWTNRRIFKVDNGWSIMDVVGLRQVDLDDVEACVRSDKFDPNVVGQFLGDTCLYLLSAGPVIKDGHTIDAPDGTCFRAKSFKQALMIPPRGTLRLFPEDGTTPPKEFGAAESEKKKKWWFWK